MKELIPINYNHFVKSEQAKWLADCNAENVAFFNPKNGKLYDKDDRIKAGSILLGICDDGWYPIYDNDNVYLGYYDDKEFFTAEQAIEFWK